MIMTRPKKFIFLAITTGLLANALPLKAQADSGPSLTVYAGPQTVSPLETIYVTVEVTDSRGKNMDTHSVQLSYMSDGELKSLSGTPKNGLISFDIPAQKSGGLMAFSALAKGTKSSEALVTIAAGAPNKLSLKFAAHHEDGNLKVFSEVIKDDFGNSVSDLSLVTLNWLANDNLIGSQSLHLSNGRINSGLSCPAQASGSLKVQALLNNLVFISPDLSEICRTDKV